MNVTCECPKPDSFYEVTSIIGSVLAGLGLLVNIFQSIKMGHFKSTCCKYFSLDMGVENQEKK